MPFRCPPGRVGRVRGILDAVAGFLLAQVDVGRGGSTGGETVGAKSEGWGITSASGVSKPVKAGRAGRLAKIETGCCFFSGNDSRADRLAKSEVGGLSFFWEDECRNRRLSETDNGGFELLDL